MLPFATCVPSCPQSQGLKEQLSEQIKFINKCKQSRDLDTDTVAPARLRDWHFKFLLWHTGIQYIVAQNEK